MRPRLKRREMGKIIEKYSKKSFLTHTFERERERERERGWVVVIVVERDSHTIYTI